MAHILAFDHKALWLILEAVEYYIATQTERYTSVNISEDAEGDFGNDLHYLKNLRDTLSEVYNNASGHAKHYQCWSDQSDHSISLVRLDAVDVLRSRGSLSDDATLLYTVPAETGEEAMAVHHLRQGFEPYQPQGKAAPCPKCKAIYYPEGYGDCWRCGHIG